MSYRSIRVRSLGVSFFCVLGVTSCGTHPGRTASPASLAHDPVTEIRTVIHLVDGPEDRGVMKWRDSAQTLLREIPMSAFSVNDEGYLTAFYPAFAPAAGVEEPPADVPLRYLRFNAAGQIVGWEAYAPEELPSCSLQKTGTPPVYYCINNSCNSPNACVVQCIYSPDGTLKDVYCDCTTTP